MRLLNTGTHEFEEYFDRPTPSYAILSHRWEEREISYQTYRRLRVKDGPAIRKILQFCEFAKTWQTPYQYVWIDTCCINKHNSTELFYSINSMYKWYRNAETCFVYLRDLPGKEEGRKGERREAFRTSGWFKRGWTLQELLAPSRVVFCDRKWEVYGCKTQLAKQIERLSGIAKPFLDGTHLPQQASVAMRMSWASKRQTTKPEDMAYCLLGLFDVNMPLMYGEGIKAFIRLQEEIIKRSDDESIFAWRKNISSRGMLAPSPDAFSESGDIVNFKLPPEQRMPYEMTNKGLRFPSASDTYAADHPDPSTAEPMGYETHTVELGCFYGDGRCITCKHPHAEDMWDVGPLTIELERKGTAWQRINCSQLEQGRNRARRRRRNGSYWGRSVQRIYFVEQPPNFQPNVSASG